MSKFSRIGARRVNFDFKFIKIGPVHVRVWNQTNVNGFRGTFGKKEKLVGNDLDVKRDGDGNGLTLFDGVFENGNTAVHIDLNLVQFLWNLKSTRSEKRHPVFKRNAPFWVCVNKGKNEFNHPLRGAFTRHFPQEIGELIA